MTQKQTIGVVLGCLGLVLLFSLVYWQFTGSHPSETLAPSYKTTPLAEDKKAAVPETIDDISLSIQEETEADFSALDDEANGEVLDIESDNESVTNLETSYDENDF